MYLLEYCLLNWTLIHCLKKGFCGFVICRLYGLLYGLHDQHADIWSFLKLVPQSWKMSVYAVYWNNETQNMFQHDNAHDDAPRELHEDTVCHNWSVRTQVVYTEPWPRPLDSTEPQSSSSVHKHSHTCGWMNTNPSRHNPKFNPNGFWSKMFSTLYFKPCTILFFFLNP